MWFLRLENLENDKFQKIKNCMFSFKMLNIVLGKKLKPNPWPKKIQVTKYQTLTQVF